MPLDYVNKIIELAAVASPKELPNANDWSKVERELKLSFPQDFKALVSALGTGHFGVGVWLRNPVASSEHLVLSHEALVQNRELIRYVEAEVNFKLYPGTRGLVPIASMDDQDFLLRPDKSGRFLADLVLLDVGLRRAKEVIGMSFSQFIYDLYFGHINEKWAVELRAHCWRDGSAPFFTPWRGP